MAVSGLGRVSSDFANRPEEGGLDLKNRKVEAPDKQRAIEEFRGKAKDNKWEVLDENSILPPVSKLNPKREDTTTITFQYEGKTYAVSQYLSPFKYAVLEGKLTGTELNKNDNNVNLKIENSQTTDFMNAKTTEGDKTVGELFNANMKKEWGKLSLDDPRRQYYELLQAKAALIGGYDYLPYQTKPTGNEPPRGKDIPPLKGEDRTNYLDKSVLMDQASTYGLLKEEEISKKLAALSERKEVVDGVEDLMKDAVSKIKDKKGLTENVYNTMKDGKYMDMLKSMSPDAAKVRFANDLKSLDFLDKKKATEIRNQVLDKGLIDEISNIIDNKKYSKESLELAVKDHVDIALQGTFSAIFGVNFMDAGVQNYLKNGQASIPDDIKKGLDSYKAAVKIATNSILDSFKANGTFNIADVSNRIQTVLSANNPDVPTGVRNGAAALLHASIMNGALPAAGGILVTTAAIYSLTKNKGDTLEERIGAARAFMVTISTSPALAQASSKTLGKIFNQPGMATMLGLENNTQLRDTFVRLFPRADDAVSVPRSSIHSIELDDLRSIISGSNRSTGSLNSVPSLDTASFVTARSDRSMSFQTAMEQPNQRISAANSTDHLSSLTPDQRSSLVPVMDERIRNMGLDPNALDGPGKYRIVGTVMNVVGGIADTVGGILDIALGAMSIDKLRKDPNAKPGDFAASTMQILGGISGVGMAGTSLASMIAGPALAAGLGIASAGLGIAGLVFGGIAAIIAAVMAKQKQDQKAEDVRQDFRDWSKLGVTEDNWGDKLNYLIHTRHEYDKFQGTERYNKLFPENKPVWEARPDQYNDFTKYVKEHGNISDNWFKDWDRDHKSGIDEKGKDAPDRSGLPRFGDEKKPGGFDDFKRDVDRVDVGSIELTDGGRVIFKKDGFKQVIDPAIGGKASEKDRQKIIKYLTDLYELSHPGGKRDQQIIDKITKLHDESDRYNDIDDLKRALDGSKPALLGKDSEGNVGSFNDFKQDIDRVDVGSIKLDPNDSNSIIFVKDGKSWQLKKDNSGSLSGQEAEKIFDYLKNLYVITHPNGNLDKGLVEKITKLHDESDDYNDLDKLRSKLGLDKDPTGLPVFGGGDARDASLGTFDDFKQDIDRVDVKSIELLDDGRVIFKKDGIKQVINPSDGARASNETRQNIIRYLTGLHELTHPKGEFDEKRADKMNSLFGASDKYNDLNDIRRKLEMEEKANGLSYFGDGGSPGTYGDFKRDIDRVNVGSIELLDDGRIIFQKDGVKQVLSVTYGGDASQKTREDIFKYLKGLYELARPGGNFSKERADKMDEIFRKTDKYNDLDKIKEYLEK